MINRLVVLRICRLDTTTTITNRLPTNPNTAIIVKMVGTTTRTTFSKSPYQLSYAIAAVQLESTDTLHGTSVTFTCPFMESRVVVISISFLGSFLVTTHEFTRSSSVHRDAPPSQSKSSLTLSKRKILTAISFRLFSLDITSAICKKKPPLC